MEILENYEFRKPSRSRYAPAVTALIDEGVFAVRLKRGPDFSQNTSLDAVQGAVSTLVRKHGRRARTFREGTDAIVISLYPDGEGPKPARKRARAKAAA